ncbi:MAG: ATP synthase F1 subunit delta [Chloroflexi bacterium]|nr:ATP synthase F1 subunit delta [Chloroflexota bacterium]|tara:strand:+ start:310 stop:846 length:537 start_codon:yes stop_codon:yes gene_type:complete
MATSARRYAQAAFSIASENDEIEKWLSEIKDVSKILSDNDCITFFDAEQIPIDVKLDGVKKLFSKNISLVQNLISLMVTRKDISKILELSNIFISMTDEYKGIVKVDITTAVPIAKENLEKITKKIENIENKKVVINKNVDKNILGGIVIRIGDKLIDGSTKNKINLLNEQLIGHRNL